MHSSARCQMPVGDPGRVIPSWVGRGVLRLAGGGRWGWVGGWGGVCSQGWVDGAGSAPGKLLGDQRFALAVWFPLVVAARGLGRGLHLDHRC